jgi:hypothetical protein
MIWSQTPSGDSKFFPKGKVCPAYFPYTVTVRMDHPWQVDSHLAADIVKDQWKTMHGWRSTMSWQQRELLNDGTARHE